MFRHWEISISPTLAVFLCNILIINGIYLVYKDFYIHNPTREAIKKVIFSYKMRHFEQLSKPNRQANPMR